jgi:signal transduction histidine kinase
MNSIRKSDIRLKTVENTEKLIDESIKTLKEVSNKLSPHILDNFGLLKAIKTFINTLPSNVNPRIHLNSNLGDQRFDYTTEVVFYRIVCELISNSMKYANCGNIYIDINIDAGSISLTYIDDGKGFDYSGNLPGNGGMGLANIQSRIRSLGGSFNIFTRPGEGVRVEIEAKTKNQG